jgi:hypothetical protein
MLAVIRFRYYVDELADPLLVVIFEFLPRLLFLQFVESAGALLRLTR